MTDSFPAWYPPAVRKLIPAGDRDPHMRPVIVSFHVAASLLRSLFAWFNGPSAGIESHLYLLRDGSWEQYRQFGFEADGQLGGNTWIGDGGLRLGSIIVETQGLGPGFWTKAQKAAMKEFLLWAHTELAIPLQQVPTPNPRTLAGGGVGYHSLFPQWNSLKKTCPGPRRIAWFKAHLVPWMAEQSHEFLTVNPGETLTDIATRGGVSVARLWRLNRALPAAGDKMRVRQ